MNISIFAFTKRGCETARIVEDVLSSKGYRVNIYATEKLSEAITEESGDSFHEKNLKNSPAIHAIEKPSKDFYGKLFREEHALVFIGATGIAVREIAPFVKDKREDPAVISLDEKGAYIIPLLSGHIGGANSLAKLLADELGGTAVITTATDINGKFSVDTWAQGNGFVISDMSLAKKVSSEILEKTVVLISDFPVKKTDDKHSRELGLLPVYQGNPRKAELKSEGYNSLMQEVDLADVKIYLGYKENPFSEKSDCVPGCVKKDNVLRLIPRILHLGIGCRKGTDKDAIKAAVEKVFKENNLNISGVKQIGSIDIKKNEKGILSLAEDLKVPFAVFDAEELKKVPGEYEGSEFVEQITGVDNVCQRAAMASALTASCIMDKKEGGKFREDISNTENLPTIIVEKRVFEGITISVAAEYLEVDLG